MRPSPPHEALIDGVVTDPAADRLDEVAQQALSFEDAGRGPRATREAASGPSRPVPLRPDFTSEDLVFAFRANAVPARATAARLP
jgi:hypothetical protein